MKFSTIAKSLSAALASTILLPQAAIANQISGTVTDENGQLLSNGYVQIMGTNKRAKLDENGSFSFTDLRDGEFELHVSSSAHIHSSDKVTINNQQPVELNIEVIGSSIEVFDVTASAFHASNIESAAPVSILAGERLKQQQAATLGETLKNQVGVHSSFYGGVTSSPIIRGLDGPRVLITQNGMDAADASRVGPDHLVSTESSTVEQIEVLRGPATLFYGSGAIGGVVNLVDNRIPDDNLQEGEVSLSRNTNNSEEAFNGRFKTGSDNIAVQVHGFYRDSDDYRIPGFAESEEAHDDHDEEDHEDEEHEEGSFGVVENSASRTQGLTFGASYLFDAGHVGFSMEHMSSLYGVPGHAHGEEEHDEEEHGEEEHEEEFVKADLRQNRYQMAGEFQLSSELVSAVNFGIAYTDYQHTELENGVPGTRFKNELFETRVEILHQPLADWRGGISLHTKVSDFSAVGEEAFTPPSDTKSFGIGLIEERHFGDVLVQLGARIERVNIDVPSVFAPEIEFIEMHEEEHDEHEEHEEHEDHDEMIDAVSMSFTPVSLSAGLVWDIASGYNFAASYVHAKRAPSSAELFSFGPHIGTQTYEIGALYELHEEGDETHVEFNNANINMEASNNIDLSLRKFGGDFGVVFNVFYNDVEDYYYAANTGLFAAFSHEHEEDHEEEHEEEHSEEGLPVFAYAANDAELYGAEIQLTWQASDTLTFTAQGDYIRAKIDSGNLPRIPAKKAIFSADYKTDNLTVSAQITHMFEQNKVASYETPTDAYTLLDVNASYFTEVKDLSTELYLRARNITDEEARVHTSFLKDLAPLPGRALELGVRMQF
ncbi:MAG: TonB-dependent receptor [Glaciecola sp.]